MLHPVIIIDYAMQRFFVLIFLLFLSISARIPDNFCAAFPFPVLPVHSYGNDINYTHPYGRHSPLHYPENDRKKPLPELSADTAYGTAFLQHTPFFIHRDHRSFFQIHRAQINRCIPQEILSSGNFLSGPVIIPLPFRQIHHFFVAPCSNTGATRRFSPTRNSPLRL